MTRTLRITLAYDGSDFHGWARQPGLRTVEGALREALQSVFAGPTALAVAGRTDTGVHALRQVASVVVEGGPPPARTARALDARLPPDVAVLAVTEAAAGFDARHSARARAYLYRVRMAAGRSPLDARRVLQRPTGTLDRALLDALTRLVVGTHDFRAFTPIESQHTDFVRTVHHAAWHERDGELRLTIAADRFLRHQVRTLVGTLLQLAREAGDVDRLARLLAGAPRTEAGPTAPPHALYLAGVRFEGEPEGRELAGIPQLEAVATGVRSWSPPE